MFCPKIRGQVVSVVEKSGEWTDPTTKRTRQYTSCSLSLVDFETQLVAVVRVYEDLLPYVRGLAVGETVDVFLREFRQEKSGLLTCVAERIEGVVL